MLHEMGYALEVDRCAVTGGTDGLIYVSPKSGRAVSRDAAGAWADRLLPLPPILRGVGEGPDHEIAQAFQTTGYFLQEHLARDLGNMLLPEARARLIDAFTRRI